MMTIRKIHFLFLILLIAASGFRTEVAKAESLEDLNRQIQEKQAQLDAQKRTIRTLQDMVSALDAQSNLTQQQIDLTNNQIAETVRSIDNTEKQIAQKQRELDTQKQNLFETMRVIYETPQQSTVEIIVGSNSLSEIVDRSQYIEALNYQIETTMNVIMQLKAQLEDQRNQLEQQKANLQNQKNTLVDKKRNLEIQQDEKARLLSQAQTSFNQALAEKDALSARMQSLLSRGGYTTGSTGGYWWANGDPDGVDPWRFYYRQCTSYAAWYWNIVLHKDWYAVLPPGQNNANHWPILAQMQGYSVSSTPRVGAIISWTAISTTGHVAIVEAVNSDGTIDVSDYNWARDSSGAGIYAYHSHLDPSILGPYAYIY